MQVITATAPAENITFTTTVLAVVTVTAAQGIVAMTMVISLPRSEAVTSTSPVTLLAKLRAPPSFRDKSSVDACLPAAPDYLSWRL